LDALNATPFARWVSAHAGQTVPRQAIERAFARGFGLPDASALQLQCAARPGAARKDQLEQLWFTIATDRLAAFPAALSFAPGRRGNCAAQVHIATLPDRTGIDASEGLMQSALRRLLPTSPTWWGDACWLPPRS
ncbi:MAG: hypothetical protein AB7S55_04720, partial [Thiomonas sp.]